MHSRRAKPRRAMWADYPGPQDWAPEAPYLGQGGIQMHGASEPAPAPLATIHLPNGKTHDVMPTPRERIGFRLG